MERAASFAVFRFPRAAGAKRRKLQGGRNRPPFSAVSVTLQELELKKPEVADLM